MMPIIPGGGRWRSLNTTPEHSSDQSQQSQKLREVASPALYFQLQPFSSFWGKQTDICTSECNLKWPSLWMAKSLLRCYHLLVLIGLYAQELMVFLMQQTLRSGPQSNPPSEPASRNTLRGQYCPELSVLILIISDKEHRISRILGLERRKVGFLNKVNLSIAETIRKFPLGMHERSA